MQKHLGQSFIFISSVIDNSGLVINTSTLSTITSTTSLGVTKTSAAMMCGRCFLRFNYLILFFILFIIAEDVIVFILKLIDHLVMAFIL